MDSFHKYCRELPGAYSLPHLAIYKDLISSSRYKWQISCMALRMVRIIADQYAQQHLAYVSLFELQEVITSLVV
jgi:hypothetical protein